MAGKLGLFAFNLMTLFVRFIVIELCLKFIYVRIDDAMNENLLVFNLLHCG